MSGRSYMGIPREEIPWFPTIDTDKCTSCGSCLDFCANDVFLQGDSAMTVANPFNCVVGCSSCRRICPGEAISFPGMEGFKVVLAALRESHAKRT